jgi:hypothetical protein
VAEAEARLPELLRFASSSGPQRIGAEKRYIVMAEDDYEQLSKRHEPLGIWLVKNMAPAASLAEELPQIDRRDPPRAWASA